MKKSAIYYAIDRKNTRTGTKMPTIYADTREEADARIKTWTMQLFNNVATLYTLPDDQHEMLGTFGYNADSYQVEKIS